jgi:hypothetical protein
MADSNAPDGRSWSDSAAKSNPQGRIDQAFSNNGPAPIDRIKAAFDAMRSGPEAAQRHGRMSGPAHDLMLTGSTGPDAVMMGTAGAPGQPMNLASHGVVNVPDLPRQAPQEEPQQQPMGFFMRNAMMQQRPRTAADT